MQAIRTTYFGPTNYRGSRIKAKAAAGSITLPWNYALNPEGNHRAAALALAAKFDWPGTYVAGDLVDGSSVFVNVRDFGAGFTLGAPAA